MVCMAHTHTHTHSPIVEVLLVVFGIELHIKAILHLPDKGVWEIHG